MCAFVLFSINKTNAQTINDWENPEVNGINKEKPHAYGFLADEKANDPMIQSLNGIWKFKWSNKIMGDSLEWKKSHVERAVSLVQRDKNIPNVFSRFGCAIRIQNKKCPTRGGAPSSVL